MLAENAYHLALKMYKFGGGLMWGIDDLINQESGFIGVISSSIGENELELFKDYIRNNFANDGPLVYICSSDVKKKCLEFLDELDINFKKLININRLTFISRDDYKENTEIKLDSLLDKVEQEITRLSEIDLNKKPCVYISIDSFWNIADLYNIRRTYKRFRKICDDKRANIIIRYIVEDINRLYVMPIIHYHDYLVIDGVDNFDVYTPDDLIYKSLVTLTERRTMEYKYNNAMMRNELLEKSGPIIGGIIHDVNNLLVSILGHAQYSLQIDDMDEIKKGLEIITRLALDGSSVTKRIKYNIKRNYETQKNICKFDYIIANCIDMIKHRFKSLTFDKRNTLELDVSLSSKQYIYANEYDMRHSIINIIQNGIEAMGDRGVMTVRTYDEGDKVVLEISDTGCGIDKEIIDKIFTPYFTTKGAKGTGLGLSLAKRIFEEHGGEIHIESEVGDGTKFTIYFPAMKLSEAVAEANEEMYNTNCQKEMI